MNSVKKILITSALPYVNNVPHLGNIIGSTLSADVYARFKRMKNGDDSVLYVCGTDQYGTQTVIKAMQENTTCQELCDKYHTLHKKIYDWFNIKFDVWGKTTTHEQTQLTHQIFSNLYKNGLIEERTVEQMYCQTCDLYLADRFIKGMCYHEQCKGKKSIVNGDQCDTCSNLIEAVKIIDPYCTVCKSQPEKRTIPHLYLKLHELEGKIRDNILSDSVKLTNNAKAVTEDWLRRGLISRCITRNIKHRWGTSIPVDIDIKNLDKHRDKVFYVWFDAPIGYYSIIENGLGRQLAEPWLNRDNVDWVQFLGKDNIPFHTLIFPGTILGSGENFPIVTKISCTEYLQYENKKFSKSNNIGIFGDQVKSLSDKVGINEDYWRYYLIKNRPETNDANFDLKLFRLECNADLYGNFGNFLTRIISMLNKYLHGEEYTINYTRYGNIIEGMIQDLINQYITLFENIKLKEVVKIPMIMTDYGNKMLQTEKPWIKLSTEPNNKDAIDILTFGLYIGWIATVCMKPIIPKSAGYILDYVTTNQPMDFLNHQLNGFKDISFRLKDTKYSYPFHPIKEELNI